MESGETAMRKLSGTTEGLGRRVMALAVLAALAMMLPVGMQADKKKKADAKADIDAKIKAIDYSYIVWPNPPAIARIKYVNWYSSDKEARNLKGEKQKKSAWMDRLAGTQSNEEIFSRP